MAKSVIQKIATWIGTSTTVVTILISVFLGIVLYAVNERLTEVTGLTGPRNQLSDRSKLELTTAFGKNKSVVGGWAIKRHWQKTENPIFFTWSRDPAVQTFFNAFDMRQRTGQGIASAESKGLLNNSQEAVSGKIKCLPLTSSNTTFYSPELASVARTICIATLPPFQIAENANIGLLVALSINASDSELEAVKQMLLQLQLNIYNRDYLGHETWISESQ